MKKNLTEALNDTIEVLKSKQEQEFILLKEQFHLTYESLKPANLIKGAVHKASSSPEVKHNIVNLLIGLVTGYLSKKVIIRSSHNPVKRILGTILQFGITSMVAKYSGKIKAVGENIFNRIRKNKKATNGEYDEDW